MHLPLALALSLAALAAPGSVEDSALARAVFGDPLPKIDTFEWPTRLAEIQPSLLSSAMLGEGRRIVLMVGSTPEVYPGSERAHQVRLAAVDQLAGGAWRSVWTREVTTDLPFELDGPGHCLAVWGEIAVRGSGAKRLLFVRLGSSLSGSGGIAGESVFVYLVTDEGAPKEVFRAPQAASYGAAGADQDGSVKFDLSLLEEAGEGPKELILAQVDRRMRNGNVALGRRRASAYLWTGALFEAKGRPVAGRELPGSTLTFRSDFGVKR